MYKGVELVYEAGAIIGEGPCWDDATGLLYYVDIMGKKVHVYSPETDSDKAYDTEEQIGALVLDKEGKIVAAAENGFNYLDLETGKLTLIADPEKDIAGNRFNDGKCDPKGRFWAGTMGNATDPTGSLYVMDTDKFVKKMTAGITISNGLAWSLDNKVMYYIDTALSRIDAFDYDIETGEISDRRVAVNMAGRALPDGMTIDCEGMLWVAEYFGACVSRWDPKSGKMIGEYTLPVTNVTSCAFGGRDLKTLYVTSASNGLDEAELKDQPLAGALFKIDTDVIGAESFRFNG